MSLRTILVLVGLGIAPLAHPAPAASEVDLGQFCLVAGADTIRITATQPMGSAPIVAVHFRWRGPGYQLLGSGSASTGLTPGLIDLGLIGTHATSAFGGNRICALYATLSPLGGSGPFTLTCTGLPFSGTAFTAIGTLTAVPCVGEGPEINPQ